MSSPLVKLQALYKGDKGYKHMKEGGFQKFVLH